MRILGILCVTAAMIGSANADSLIATRTLRGGEIIGPRDFQIDSATIPGAIENAAHVLGMEMRVAVYAGQPIKASDIGPPTLVSRNQPVLLLYESGGIYIATEARSLGQGGVGDMVKVMNLSSRSTVIGVVQDDGAVAVR